MGDYTTGTVSVIGGSETLRLALGRAVHTVDYGEGSTITDEHALSLIEGEYIEEVQLDFAESVQQAFEAILAQGPADELPESISISTDAKYEFCGDLYRWLPALGWHAMSVDNDSAPITTEADVRTWLELPHDVAVARLDEHLGTAWKGAGWR